MSAGRERAWEIVGILQREYRISLDAAAYNDLTSRIAAAVDEEREAGRLVGLDEMRPAVDAFYLKAKEEIDIARAEGFAAGVEAAAQSLEMQGRPAAAEEIRALQPPPSAKEGGE